MSYSNPKRLRADDSLSKPLREALRERPNPDPSAAQIESLRVRLRLGAAVGKAERAVRLVPPSSQRAHTTPRKLRRTIAALVLFPVAAAAAVGGVVELAQRATTTAPVKVAPAPNAASMAANQRQRMPSVAAASAALPEPSSNANDAVARAVEPAHAAPTRAADGSGNAELPAQVAPAASLASSGVPAVATFDVAPASSTPFGAELALLQRANAALKTDPALALALASQHRQAFPKGNLAQEREVIAIKALQALAETERAREGLASFERAYPRSAHVLELRQIVR